MNNYIKHITLPYDKNLLISEAESLEFKPFELPKKYNSWWDYVPTWLQGWIGDANVPEITRIGNIITEKLGTEDLRPRFYKQQANTELPMHSDYGTKCAINIILSDDAAPILFENGGEFKYTCALLNIQERHAVPAYPKERFLLKYSIFDIDYHEAVKRWNE